MIFIGIRTLQFNDVYYGFKNFKLRQMAMPFYKPTAREYHFRDSTLHGILVSFFIASLTGCHLLSITIKFIKHLSTN